MPRHLHQSLPVTHTHITLSSAVPPTIKINTHFPTYFISHCMVLRENHVRRDPLSCSLFHVVAEWAFPSNQHYQIWKTGPNKYTAGVYTCSRHNPLLWCSSPALWKDPEQQRTVEDVILTFLRIFFQASRMRSRLRQFRERATTLAFYTSEPVDSMNTVEDLIFRDEADIIVYDPRVSSRRRRIEWPTQLITCWVWCFNRDGGILLHICW